MPDDIITIQVKLSGARAASAEANLVSASTERMGRSARTAGAGFQHAQHRGFLLNQTLFTMRRYLYAATLGITAAGAASVLMGIKFNASMEQNEVAFTMFLGSTTKAKNELKFLFDLAKKTPFEFPWLVDASRSFLAVGFSVQEVNAMMVVLADTASAFGLGEAGISRMVLAFQQMLATGRILGGELRQLEQLGIPARKLLGEQLGLTTKQMGMIGDLGIPARTGIAAILIGMNKMPGVIGASAKQAETFNGRISTLRDNFRLLTGAITKQLFNKMRTEWLPGLNKMVEAMTLAFQIGGWDAMIQAMDDSLGSGGKLVKMWNFISTSIRVGVGILRFFFDHMGLTITLIKIYVFWWFVSRTATVAYTTAMKIHTGVMFVYHSVINGVNGAKRVYIFLTGLQTTSTRILSVAQWGNVRATNGQFVAMTRLEKAVLRLRFGFIALAAAMGLSVGWLVALIAIGIIVAAAIAYLAYRSERFRMILFKIWMVMSPLNLAVGLLGWKFGWVADHVIRLWHWLGRLYDRLSFLKGPSGLDLLGRIPGASNLPGLATGGMGLPGGTYMVGELGHPEILSLPSGSSVKPLGDGGGPAGRLSFPSLPSRIVVPVTLQIDKRTIAEAVAVAQLDSQARS
jgi:tape measure domain-containing protein